MSPRSAARACPPRPARAPAGPPPGGRWCPPPAAGCRSRSTRRRGRCTCRCRAAPPARPRRRGTTPPCRSVIGDRGLAQPQRAARVAELAPGADHVGRRGRGQVGRGGPAGEPVPPDRLHPGDRCLLQHDLADQHGPGVDARAAPRQVAGGGGVPVDDHVAGVRRIRTAAADRVTAHRNGSAVGRVEPSVPRGGQRRAGRARRARATSVRAVLHPVGKLPAAVYWRRRLMVLALVLAVLGGVAWLVVVLLGGADGETPRLRGPTGRARSSAPLPALERVVPSVAAVSTPTPPEVRGGRGAPTAAAPPAPGPGRPVHRRHDLAGGPHAAHGRGRQQADLRAAGRERLRRALRPGPSTRASRSSCSSTRRVPGSGGATTASRRPAPTPAPWRRGRSSRSRWSGAG